VDLWAFGVLLFEMMVGRPPFSSPDEKAIYRRILQINYKFPTEPNVNDISKDIIQRLLVRDQTKRLGYCCNNNMDIRKHDFFKEIDSDHLLAKKIQAPWVPSLRGPLDTSHFDSYEIEEKEQPIPGKLTPEQQNIFADF